jgi:hypothetical protein
MVLMQPIGADPSQCLLIYWETLATCPASWKISVKIENQFGRTCLDGGAELRVVGGRGQSKKEAIKEHVWAVDFKA